MIGQRSRGYEYSVLDRTEYQAPVHIIMGDKDYTVSFSVEKAYYDRIAALEKTYAEFEGGH